MYKMIEFKGNSAKSGSNLDKNSIFIGLYHIKSNASRLENLMF